MSAYFNDSKINKRQSLNLQNDSFSGFFNKSQQNKLDRRVSASRVDLTCDEFANAYHRNKAYLKKIEKF